MTVHNLPFNGPMIRALLREIEAPGAGKTQTRRPISPYEPRPSARPIPENLILTPVLSRSGRFTYGPAFRPRYAPGDLIWCREAHAIVPRTAYAQSVGVDQALNPDDDQDAAVYREGWERSKPGPWRPSIHMFRWASRITLEVTDVRVQRLKEISEEDAAAEGYAARTQAGLGVRRG